MNGGEGGEQKKSRAKAGIMTSGTNDPNYCIYVIHPSESREGIGELFVVPPRVVRQYSETVRKKLFRGKYLKPEFGVMDHTIPLA